MWMYDNSELMHYGVLGMKWGIRKAEKRGEQFHYKSIGQRQYERKINKMTAKGITGKRMQKASSKLEMFKERDRFRQNYAKNASIGGAVARTFLMGAWANGTYERYRTYGSGKAGALAKTIVSNLLLSPIPGGGAILSKYNENKAARRRIAEKER